MTRAVIGKFQLLGGHSPSEAEVAGGGNDSGADCSPRVRVIQATVGMILGHRLLTETLIRGHKHSLQAVYSRSDQKVHESNCVQCDQSQCEHFEQYSVSSVSSASSVSSVSSVGSVGIAECEQCVAPQCEQCEQFEEQRKQCGHCGV